MGSKFGLAARRRARGDPRATPAARASTSTSARSCATSTRARRAVDWIAGFAARARDELGWEPRTLDLGGGLGVAATPEEPELTIAEFVAGLLAALERACARHGLAPPR